MASEINHFKGTGEHILGKMKIHWKDIFDDADTWSYLEVSISEALKEGFHIQSGGKQRFKLAKGDDVIFWGCLEHDYYGAWFLRNDKQWEAERMFIAPITSSRIEEARNNNNLDNMAYWSRFFVKSLSESKSCFLNNGKWKISKSKLNWEPANKNMRTMWKVNDAAKTFDREQLTYIDWSLCYHAIISIKQSPEETDGRLKWWRKKVRENSCPPILVWHINSLNAFLLIDGHYRLKAFLLEEKAPDVLVINEVIEEHYQKDKSVQEKILKSIALRQQNERKEKLNVNEINNLLIHAFDDRPEVRPITKSVGKYNFETSWVAEVSEFIGSPNVDQEELIAMIKNE